VAGGRLVDAQAAGEKSGSEAHRRELGGADGEAAHRQGEHDQAGMVLARLARLTRGARQGRAGFGGAGHGGVVRFTAMQPSRCIAA
jgi:hypothetical protein